MSDYHESSCCAAVSGALVFAAGQTPNHLILGRILLGIGMAGNLMVLLTLLAEWFQWIDLRR